MSAATWYALPTACLPGCNSSIGKSQQQPQPHAGLCPYPSIVNISRSSSATLFDAMLLPGRLCHGEWAVPLPFGDSASSNITSGGSYAAGGFGGIESGAAYVGMFGVQHLYRAPAAAATPSAAAAPAPAAPRDTIADVLSLLGGATGKASDSSDMFADDSEPVVPRPIAKAGVCPPTPMRPLPSIMLVPAAEVVQHINCTAA